MALNENENSESEFISKEQAEDLSHINVTDEEGSFKAQYEAASAAVALSYHEGDASPFVSALGYESRADPLMFSTL